MLVGNREPGIGHGNLEKGNIFIPLTSNHSITRRSSDELGNLNYP